MVYFHKYNVFDEQVLMKALTANYSLSICEYSHSVGEKVSNP